jgi:hypothetical protein
VLDPAVQIKALVVRYAVSSYDACVERGDELAGSLGPAPLRWA